MAHLMLKKTAECLKPCGVEIRLDRTTPIGLPNKSATNNGYRNVVYQALLHAPESVSWIKKYTRGSDSEIGCRRQTRNAQRDCLRCRLDRLIRIYWGKLRGARSVDKALKKLNSVIDRIGSTIGIHVPACPMPEGKPGDPAEFFTWLFLTLESLCGGSIAGGPDHLRIEIQNLYQSSISARYSCKKEGCKGTYRQNHHRGTLKLYPGIARPNAVVAGNLEGLIHDQMNPELLPPNLLCATCEANLFENRPYFVQHTNVPEILTFRIVHGISEPRRDPFDLDLVQTITHYAEPSMISHRTEYRFIAAISSSDIDPNALGVRHMVTIKTDNDLFHVSDDHVRRTDRNGLIEPDWNDTRYYKTMYFYRRSGYMLES